MTDDIRIEPATLSDAAALNAIYNGYIVDSYVSFDVEPWTVEKRLAWLEDRLSGRYPVLVARNAGAVVGGSWAGRWQPKQAYAGSAETTVVLSPEAIGHGIGFALYDALLGELVERGFHRAFAIIALPNDSSVGLHKKLGFREIGVLDEAGYKNGQFHSTMLLELALDQR